MGGVSLYHNLSYRCVLKDLHVMKKYDKLRIIENNPCKMVHIEKRK